jgi:hypothetical protein
VRRINARQENKMHKIVDDHYLFVNDFVRWLEEEYVPIAGGWQY